MNQVFGPYLSKFALVFFNDILVYSKDLESHLEHLQEIFKVMRQRHLYAKMSKCKFVTTEVVYLGHVISKQGVAVDQTKIEFMLNWSQPTTVKRLRGFLSLTGYYRKFIKGYGTNAKPLTKLLEKKLL